MLIRLKLTLWMLDEFCPPIIIFPSYFSSVARSAALLWFCISALSGSRQNVQTYTFVHWCLILCISHEILVWASNIFCILFFVPSQGGKSSGYLYSNVEFTYEIVIREILTFTYHFDLLYKHRIRIQFWVIL